MMKDHATYATATFYTDTPPSMKSEPSEDEEKKTNNNTDEEGNHKYDSLFASFSNQLRILDEELCIEKNYRNVQLTEIVTALLAVEAKLRREQKYIRQQLYEKDEQISYHLSEIENYKIAKRLCSKCSRALSTGGETVAVRHVEVQTERQQDDFKIENINHRVTITTINNEKDLMNIHQTTNCIYVSGERDGESMQRISTSIPTEKPKPPIAKIRTVKPLANCEEVPANVNPLQVNEDWYSSSDIEDNECISTNLYDRSVNPVLECVNQILLQQSIEGNLESTRSYDEVKRRRVQFSTQNSLVSVPSNDDPPTNGCEYSNGHKQGQTTENEYEFIGSEIEKESSLYVDMDRKSFQPQSGAKNVEPSKTPPALPPKPANLMKFRKVIKPDKVLIKVSTPVKQLAVEPDYCSIASVSEKSKSDCDDFDAIPKLPNVAAILVPKRTDAGTMGRFINKDNYVTKTVMNIQNNSPATKEPNNNVNNKNLNHQLNQSVVEIPFTGKIFEERIPIQAEFDWYNLDAEYGKFNQADVIKETSDSSEADTAVSIVQNTPVTDRYYVKNSIIRSPSKQSIVSSSALISKKAGSEVHLC